VTSRHDIFQTAPEKMSLRMISKQARKKRMAPVEDPGPSEEGLTSDDEAGGAPVVKVHGNKKLRRHCDEEGCGKGSVGSTGKCIAHGGGRRCDEPNCEKVRRPRVQGMVHWSTD